MPFVLREDGDTSNPPLATVYGKQITAGKLVYYLNQGGRSTAILLLGDGEMDGIDRLIYNGEIVPEFADEGRTDRNWRFHPGSLTTQPVFNDVTAISGATLTLNSNPYVVGDAVAVVAGKDPEPSPFPSEVKQHQLLYVVSTSGADVQLSTTLGGSPVVWTSSAYLLTNLKVYKANAGYFDPIQGRPEFFPSIDFTFSGIAYIEVRLPAAMSEVEDDAPTKFKIFVRGRRIQNYDANGMLADELGVAYNPLALPAQTKFFSANNALVALDIILNYMKVEKSRIDWPSFVAFRQYCDQSISWDSGNTQILANPTMTPTNATISIPGTVVGQGANSTWTAGAITVESTNSLNDIKISGVYRGGHSAIGLTRNTSGVILSDSNNIGSIGIDTAGNNLGAWVGSTNKYAIPVQFAIGDTFMVEVSGGNVNFYRNGSIFYTEAHGLGAGTTRGWVSFYTNGGSFSDVRFFPVAGGTRVTNRFDAHVVFPGEVDAPTALQTIFGRCPSCHWQDVNGKIKFIVGTQVKDITEGEVAAAGERVIADVLSYDPTTPNVRSNIVSSSFSSYKTPPENKPNFLILELRDIDDVYFTKKYVYNDRDALQDQTGKIVDFGIVPVGVASQSLADRLGEAVLRWSSDLDLFVSVRATADTYALSKGDIVKFAHEVPSWTLDSPVLFIVIEETIESGTDTADEKSYLLQAYSENYYSDTAHGAITASFPNANVSSLTPPPPPSNVDLSEVSRTLPDGTVYNSILGSVVFDSSYVFNQRARVYWKRPLDLDYAPTNIVLEQPNTGVTSLPFELSFAPAGTNEIRVVTETLTGILSNVPFDTSIELTGSAQVEEVEWEKLVNAEYIGTYIVKTAGGLAWDAAARSTKEVSYGDAYLQFTPDDSSIIMVGFTNNQPTDANAEMLYGIRISEGVKPELMIGRVAVAANSDAINSSFAAGHSYKVSIEGSTVNFYQVVGGVSTLIGTTSNLNAYPLFVDAAIWTSGGRIPPVQVYGKLESTTGFKVHWQSLRAVSVSSVGGKEIITKVLPDGWVNPLSAGTFSAERITGEGAIEWEATELGTYRLLGLSTVDAELTNPDIAGFMGIRYGLYMEADGTYSIRELGVYHYIGFYSPGDIFRVERMQGQIRYRKNGVLVYTSTEAYTTAPLYADTSLYSQNSTIKDVRMKKVGNFTTPQYVYPIYLVQNLVVLSDRPQDDGTAYFELAGTFITEGEAPILRAKVRVFNKFGTLIMDYPPFTFAGNGVIAQGYHDRKYADPNEEAIYEVKLENAFGMSAPIYLKGTGAYPPVFNRALTMPIPLNPATSIQDLTCVSTDHSTISTNWTFPSGVSAVDIQYRQSNEAAWAAVPSGTNVSTKPFILTGLVPNTYYEFRVSPTGTGVNWSNICRTKTLQSPLPTDTAPSPLNLVVVPTSGASASSADLSWGRNSTTNTGVKVFKDGVQYGSTLAAGATSLTVTGLTAGVTYVFTVKNVYAGGDSAASNAVSHTPASAPSATAPSGLTATATSTSRVGLLWVNNTTSGTVTIQMDEGFGWTNIATVPATQGSYSVTGLAAETGYNFRVSNSGAPTSYSNEAFAFTYVMPDTSCVSLSTLIWVLSGELAIQVPAHTIKEGDIVLSVGKLGKLEPIKVKKVWRGSSDTLYIITTVTGKSVECTPSHPLVVNEELEVIKAVSLKKGDKLLTHNLDNLEQEVVESKESLSGDFEVVIFELEDSEHTFISGDIVSHNREMK